MKKFFVGAVILALSVLETLSATEPITVNTLNREEVVNFFQTVYLVSEGIPIGWTGDVANCIAGTISQAYQDATLLRINYFRAMAGLPGDITFDESKNAKCQQAVLMMSAKRDLSHYPDNDWPCYTADGAEAAARSNLALGIAGPDAINAYMDDSGPMNYSVGHRRWILRPPAKSMGSGSISPDGYPRSNALWGDFDSGDRLAQPTWVAWPPQGSVPHQVLPRYSGRWSFSYFDADFANASVFMQLNGENVALTLEQRNDYRGYGSTIVWIPQGVPSNPPAIDTTYSVTVSNVVINGIARTFTYDVTVIDPGVLLNYIKLNIQTNGNEITLSWSDPATKLEEADDITGPWRRWITGGSSSPHVVIVSSNRKFYRLWKY